MKTILLTSALITILSLLVAGCDKKDEHAGHNHASEPRPTKESNAKESDSHDHDHDHDHDEHGHDHEESKASAADKTEHKDHDHASHDDHDHGEHEDEIKLTKEAVERAGIRTEAVKKQQLSQVFAVPGRLAFNTDNTAHVGSAITGRAVEIKAKVGDRVKAGDVLLIVDSAELGEAQSDLLTKISAAQAAAPLADFARAAHERGKALHAETQGISLTEVQKREADLRSAEAALITAKAAVTAAQHQLRLKGMSPESIERLTKSGVLETRIAIHAPIAGEVIDREITLGEIVRPDKDALFLLADLSSLWVIADVPEARLAEVAIGASAMIAIAATGESVNGKISYIAPQLDSATRTASVRIDVAQNKNTALRPGMFSQVSIVSSASSSESVLAVRDHAIQIVEGGPAVFVPVAGEANTFAKRSVKIGARVGEWVPVIGGLEEGDQVVVSGAFVLKADLGKAGAAHEH